MRAVIPPWPFISGHALLTGYGVLSAQGWPLRVISLLVLFHVVYTKLLVTGGWKSMVAGFVVAALLSLVRRGAV